MLVEHDDDKDEDDSLLSAEVPCTHTTTHPQHANRQRQRPFTLKHRHESPTND